jgi:hypothetical protein
MFPGVAKRLIHLFVEDAAVFTILVWNEAIFRIVTITAGNEAGHGFPFVMNSRRD